MSAQQQGTITTWKDAQGFGFITPAEGGPSVFFHISAVASRGPRPSERTAVVYTLAYDERRRPYACDVRYARQPAGATWLSWVAVVLWFAILISLTVAHILPPLILAAFAISSSLTIGAYRLDKASAIQGERRIPEQTLHLLEILGGWPGALLAQAHFRHKTAKTSYQLAFWTIVTANIAAVALLGAQQALLRP